MFHIAVRNVTIYLLLVARVTNICIAVVDACFPANMTRMRRLIFFVLLGAFLLKNVNSLAVRRYPSNLRWLFRLNDKSSDNMEQTVCQTEECKEIANVILERMNKSVDPCDDFYEYACGQWAANNSLKRSNIPLNLFHILKIHVIRQIRDIFKKKPKKGDPFVVKFAKKWYATCMDTNAMDKQGLESLMYSLTYIGGWPIIMRPGEWDEEKYNWQKIDNHYARLTGSNTFHNVRVYRNATKYRHDVIVHIDTPHLFPGWYELYLLMDSDEELSGENDEDTNDENKQSNESEDHAERKNDGEDESDKNLDTDEDDYDYEDDSDDEDDVDNNSNNNDSDDDDNGTDESDKDANARKKKFNGKLSHKKKHKRLTDNKKRKSHNQTVKRYNNYNKEKKQRIKKYIITTKSHSKHSSSFIGHNKSNERKTTKHEKILNHKKTLHMVMKTRFTTEESNEEDDKLTQQYINYIAKVARALAKERGIEIPNEQIEKDIEDMMEFHRKLIDIVQDFGEDLYLTLHKFQEWYDKKYPKNENSKINWVYKITDLFYEANINVNGSLDIKVGSPDYFKGLVSLLDETSSRTIVNYVHWNFISKMLITTTSEMRKLYNTWQKVYDPSKMDEERSIKCMKEVETYDLLWYEYVRKYFSEDILRNGMDMINDIQKEVKYLIKESDWMDADTKNFVLAKLMNMKELIGYPNWYRNTTIVKQYFRGLIMGRSYYENTLSYTRYYKWQQLRILTRNVKNDFYEGWWFDPTAINAQFFFGPNTLSITAADFQSPFFAYNRPQAVNFAIIGFIMAHEVNHAFDSTGRFYNKNGKFVEWLSIMANAYNKKSLCFVEQYNNYTVDKKSNTKIKDYGNQTVDENIADTMGLQALFRAYRRERESGKPDKALPGLEEFTNDQLFFLSFASTWCEVAVNSEMVIQAARTDPHSTGRLRVIGTVSNSKDFAKTYNCPVDSPMNPQKKCNIWK